MTYDYEFIRELSLKLNRPGFTLIALDNRNNPFYINPGRQARAEWFRDIHQRLGGTHTRRVRSN